MQMHDEAPALATAFQNAFLLNGTTWLNSPLWSLRWEVIFSLLLPLYVWVALRWGRRWWPLIGAGLISAIVTGDLYGVDALRFLSYFGLGALLAVNIDALSANADKASRSGRATVVQVLFLAGTVILLTWRWWPGPFLPSALTSVGAALTPVGAVGIVIAAVGIPVVRRVLSSRILVSAGAISFSLYLVHEPILVTLAVIAPTDASWMPVVVGIPLALAASLLFYVLVERNTHRVARWVARICAPQDLASRPLPTPHLPAADNDPQKSPH